MSQRPAWREGIRPSNPVLTIFSVKPSFFTTAWYDSTSNPTGVFGSVGWKNSIGEYSMSTQLESSPAFSSEVGAAIALADGATDALAAALAGADAGAPALAEAGGAEAPPPVEHADRISPAVPTS